MTPHLTEDGLEHILDRLRVHYGVPKAYKEDPSGYSREWMNILKFYRVEELNRALDLWVGRGEKYRPTPGELKALCYVAKPQKQVYHRSEENRRQSCLCGDPHCDLRLYRTPSGIPRLYMDCLARQRGYEAAP